MNKIKPLLFRSELLVFHEINAALRNSDIHVIPQQTLQSVINVQSLSLTTKERKTAKNAVFDFIITDKETNPLFAIEFDGPWHYDCPKTHESDLRKISICDKAGLPLLRIDYKLYDKFEKSKIVSFIVYRYLKWISEKDQLSKEFQEKVEYQVSIGKSSREIFDYFCVSEPEIEFNFKYYFPEIYNLEKKLFDEYKLYPETLEQGDKKEFQSKYTITHFASPETHEGIVKTHSALKVSGKFFQNGSENKYEKEFIGDEIEVQWLFSIYDEENTKLNPLKMKNIAYYRSVTNGIPGTQLMDLCTMLAEYNYLQKMINEIKQLDKVFINPDDEDLMWYFSRKFT